MTSKFDNLIETGSPEVIEIDDEDDLDVIPITKDTNFVTIEQSKMNQTNQLIDNFQLSNFSTNDETNLNKMNCETIPISDQTIDLIEETIDKSTENLIEKHIDNQSLINEQQQLVEKKFNLNIKQESNLNDMNFQEELQTNKQTNKLNLNDENEKQLNEHDDIRKSKTDLDYRPKIILKFSSNNVVDQSNLNNLISTVNDNEISLFKSGTTKPIIQTINSAKSPIKSPIKTEPSIPLLMPKLKLKPLKPPSYQELSDSLDTSIKSKSITKTTTNDQNDEKFNLCTRVGCRNKSIKSDEWDNEYCSGECLIKHCKDQFNFWRNTRKEVKRLIK